MSEKERRPGGRPFAKGVSGNPGGIPKGYVRERRGFDRRLRECVEAMQADDPMPDPDAEVVLGSDGQPLPPPKIPAFEAIVKQAVKAAIDGDRYARDFIADRLMGKAKQTIAVTDAEIDADDESDLDGLSPDELRVLAKVRARSVRPSSNDVH